MAESTLKGSCLCGGVAYEMSPPFVFFHHCHCSRCQKSSGSAFGANILVKAAQFRWTRGEELVGHWELPEAAVLLHRLVHGMRLEAAVGVAKQKGLPGPGRHPR